MTEENSEPPRSDCAYFHHSIIDFDTSLSVTNGFAPIKQSWKGFWRRPAAAIHYPRLICQALKQIRLDAAAKSFQDSGFSVSITVSLAWCA